MSLWSLFAASIRIIEFKNIYIRFGVRTLKNQCPVVPLLRMLHCVSLLLSLPYNLLQFLLLHSGWYGIYHSKRWGKSQKPGYYDTIITSILEFVILIWNKHGSINVKFQKPVMTQKDTSGSTLDNLGQFWGQLLLSKQLSILLSSEVDHANRKLLRFLTQT